MKPITQWFKIDNAGKLFPVVHERLRSSYFRQAVELKQLVDPVTLQEAAALTVKRFPHFNTRLKKGLFWNYLETQQRLIHVLPEPNAFGSLSRPYDSSKHLIEIYYHRNRIAIEIFHAVTDGRGGMEFLKTLTLAYLKLKGFPVSSEGMLFDAQDQVASGELEDSFDKKVLPGKKEMLPAKKAFHLKGKVFSTVGHYLTHLHFSSQKIIEVSRSLHTTATGFLVSVMIFLLLQKQNSEHPKKRRPIIISVPVDMRKYLPSITMKNFVMTINVGKVFPENSTFDDVLKEVDSQLKAGQTIEKLAPQIRANMQAERLLLVRFIPLMLKNMLIKFFFNRVGEPAMSMAISNLGKVTMPESSLPFIKHFEFMVCSSFVMPINMAVVSFEDDFVLTISRIITDREFVVKFVQYLTDNFQIPIQVTGNRWEEQS
jgi:hypothetical protein